MKNSPNFQALSLKKPIVIDNVDDDPNWVKTSSSWAVKSWIGTPLIARGKVVGLLTVDSYETE
jgi:putative methionine-R-sulfoxide reductase with GAF domain